MYQSMLLMLVETRLRAAQKSLMRLHLFFFLVSVFLFGSTFKGFSTHDTASFISDPSVESSVRVFENIRVYGGVWRC